MEFLKQKLSSRKLWACIVGVIVGIATIFGLDQNIITTISGTATILGSVASYIFAEGKIDAARISSAVSAIKDAVDVVQDSE